MFIYIYIYKMVVYKVVNMYISGSNGSMVVKLKI